MVTPEYIYTAPPFPLWLLRGEYHRVRKRDIIAREKQRAQGGKRILNITYHDARNATRTLALECLSEERSSRLNWAVSTGSPQER